MVTALPDLAAALLMRLRADANILSIPGMVASKVILEWPKNPDGTNKVTVPPFVYTLLVQTGRGGAGEIDGGIQSERVDLFCYGPDARTAHLLWRTAHFTLCPPVGSGRLSSFDAAGLHVYRVNQEAGPQRLVDPDIHWPYTWAPYTISYGAEG